MYSSSALYTPQDSHLLYHHYGEGLDVDPTVWYPALECSQSPAVADQSYNWTIKSQYTDLLESSYRQSVRFRLVRLPVLRSILFDPS
jgi:hypothetical protein